MNAFLLIPIIIFIVIVVLTGTVIFVFKNPGFRLVGGVAEINLAGKIQVWVLRASMPVFGHVDKSLGFSALPVASIASIAVDTKYGKAILKLYRPFGHATRNLPAYINFHGGGFVVGYPKQDDWLCRHIAHHANCIVINVDYVLAPEHPFPAAIFQSFGVCEWLSNNAAELRIDRRKIGIGGQSAGAHIAAVLALMAKERGRPLFCLQVLNYGYLNTQEKAAAKFVDVGSRQVLSVKMLSFFQNLYLPNPCERKNKLASPLLADDHSNLPDALIITASKDLIKNDSARYADKLSRAGNKVIYKEFGDADHGFIYNGPKQPAQEAWTLITSFIKKNFNDEHESI